MNALDLRGPEFLTWYLQWFALSVCAFFLLRWLLRRPPPAHAPLARDLDAFEIAWLKDGAGAVVRAALASLYQRKLIDMKDGVVVWRAPEPTGQLPRVEAAVFHGTRVGGQTSSFKAAVDDACDAIEARLARDGLAIAPGRKAAVRLLPPVGMLICLAIGAAKLVRGLAHDRPVSLLFVLLVVSALALAGALISVPRRTTAGSRLLRALEQRHAALRTTLESSATEQLLPSDVATGVALWGAALAVPTLADLFEPRKAHAAGGGGSCGEAGGGGCGGGGCGGGCGGCGGCGG